MVKAIFCINPGRSGSHYLSKLLSFSENCESYHEAEPSGFGTPMRKYNRGVTEEMEEISKVKIEQIDSVNRSGKIFADTSHCFIKGYAEFIARQVPGNEIGIIILKRDFDKVVDSTIRTYSMPLTPTGRKYILTPEKLNPIIEPPSFYGISGLAGYSLARLLRYIIAGLSRLKRLLTSQNKTTRYLLMYQRECIEWYIRETYALGDSFISKNPCCKYFEVNIDELNDAIKVQSMFDFFGIIPSEALWEEIGHPTNLKSHAKW